MSPYSCRGFVADEENDGPTLPPFSPLQIVPCTKTYSHKWSLCPCAHPAETVRRQGVCVLHPPGWHCRLIEKFGWMLSCLPVVRLSLPWTGPSSVPPVCELQGCSLPPGEGRECDAAAICQGPFLSWPFRTSNTTCRCHPPSQKKACPLGDSCSYAHNVFEHWLHPTR